MAVSKPPIVSLSVNVMSMTSMALLKSGKPNAGNSGGRTGTQRHLLPKRANGNYLYHECVVLGECPDVSQAKQERILLDLVEQYVKLRAPDQMVYGRMHMDTDYLHFHLCISSNSVRGKQRRWLRLSGARLAGPIVASIFAKRGIIISFQFSELGE